MESKSFNYCAELSEGIWSLKHIVEVVQSLADFPQGNTSAEFAGQVQAALNGIQRWVEDNMAAWLSENREKISVNWIPMLGDCADSLDFEIVLLIVFVVIQAPFEVLEQVQKL